MTDPRFKQSRLSEPVEGPDLLRRRERAWTFLMTLAQNGDANAYLTLLQEITPYLRFRVSRFLEKTDEIENMVQDILLTVHAVRHIYDPGRSFGPWLMAIANRRVFDRLGGRAQGRLREWPSVSQHEVTVLGSSGFDGGNTRQANAVLTTGFSAATLRTATFGALSGLRGRLNERGG